MLTPANEVGRARSGGTGPRLLIAGNAGHADTPLNAPGSALMGILMTMLGQSVGSPVPEGGPAPSPTLSDVASSRWVARSGTRPRWCRFTSRGACDRCTTVDGERFDAAQAAIADVVAQHLYGGLVSTEDLSDRTMKAMRSLDLDPSTVKVDWAFDGTVPWSTPPSHAPGTFHVADSVEQMTAAHGQVAAQATRRTAVAHGFRLRSPRVRRAAR
jgi:hypothetical protein